MKPKQPMKVCVDIAMALRLLFLMGYHLWGDTAHEWVGAGIFVLFICHHILNWHWWKGLFRGKYTAVRVLQVVIDLLVLAAMLGLMISSVILSNEVFAFLHIKGHLSFARRLHMASAYWGFFVMAAHLGLHWGMFLKMVQKTKLSGKRQPMLPPLLGAVIAVYGIVVMVKRDLPTYLFLQAEFVFLDFSESKILFYMDYLAMMGTFIFLAYFAVKLLKKRKERNTP